MGSARNPTITVLDFMNLKGGRKAPGCGSLLGLPPEICSRMFSLLVDILLSYIYNLIKERDVPRSMFIPRSSPPSSPNPF